MTVREARAIQERLRPRLEQQDRFGRVRHIAGADVAFRDGYACAGVLVFSYPGLNLTEVAHAVAPQVFPYVPGFLTFREGPALLKAFAALRTRPDLIMFDGHGVSHPAGFGLASHMGVLLKTPSIGCAKSVLVGEWDAKALDGARGAWTPLIYKAKRVGAAVRTRDDTKPIFVSTGHRVSLRTAIRIALACCAGYRIPEPTRQADIAVARLKREPRGIGPIGAAALGMSVRHP